MLSQQGQARPSSETGILVKPSFKTMVELLCEKYILGDDHLHHLK